MTEQTDEDGYLLDPSEWSEDFALRQAAHEHITLTEDHWRVIRFMRQWLDQHQVAPDVRHVIKHLRTETGAGRNYVFELFPYGYVQQACKIAGMRRPRAWSTG